MGEKEGDGRNNYFNMSENIKSDQWSLWGPVVSGQWSPSNLPALLMKTRGVL